MKEILYGWLGIKVIVFYECSSFATVLVDLAFRR